MAFPQKKHSVFPLLPSFPCFTTIIYITLHCVSISTIINGQSLGPVFACDPTSNASLSTLGFCDTSKGVDERVADLVGRLTLQEKIGYLISGSASVSRLGIPKYEWWSEALHGVSYVGPGTRFSNLVPGATSFPQVITTAASFNTSLFQAIGKVRTILFFFFFLTLNDRVYNISGVLTISLGFWYLVFLMVFFNNLEYLIEKAHL